MFSFEKQKFKLPQDHKKIQEFEKNGQAHQSIFLNKN